MLICLSDNTAHSVDQSALGVFGITPINLPSRKYASGHFKYSGSNRGSGEWCGNDEN